jgi:divalent metal cation (Fe/Co/Zn/Cd) transporter
MGFPIMDSVAAIIICIFILKTAYSMTDKACDDETVEAIRAAVLEYEAVLGIDSLRTRLFGEKIFTDIEIVVDGSVTLKEAHDVAEEVHLAIEERFLKVKHCMVRVNPGVRDV